MKHKKSISLLLSATLCAGVLGGCGAQETKTNLPVGAAENEIIAYQPVEEGKMLITVRAEFNGMPENLEEIIETQFPEVDVVLRSIPAPRKETSSIKAWIIRILKILYSPGAFPQ